MSYPRTKQPEPDVIRAKTNLNWVRRIEPIQDNAGNLVASASATDGFTAVYELRNSSNFYTISAVGSGNEYTVAQSASDSENWASGEYELELFIENGPDRWPVDSKQVEIVAYAAGAQDRRSQVKRTLDAIDAMIEGRSSKDVQEYSIQPGSGSRSLKHFSADELMTLRSKYAGLYASEQARAGKRKSIIKTRFHN